MNFLFITLSLRRCLLVCPAGLQLVGEGASELITEALISFHDSHVWFFKLVCAVTVTFVTHHHGAAITRNASEKIPKYTCKDYKTNMTQL